jgi:hypothetical protein
VEYHIGLVNVVFCSFTKGEIGCHSRQRLAGPKNQLKPIGSHHLLLTRVTCYLIHTESNPFVVEGGGAAGGPELSFTRALQVMASAHKFASTILMLI